LVYNNKWIELYEDSVRNESGSRTIFNRIRVLYDVSIVVPILEDGSLLMIDKYYHGINTNLLGLPGGLIDENESPSGAARRELMEETGYKCGTLKYMGRFYTWPSSATQTNYVYIAKGMQKCLEQKKRDFEDLSVQKMSKQEVKLKIQDGRIANSITISALLKAYFL
jgi:ADP-ribose pyrophosphatase